MRLVLPLILLAAPLAAQDTAPKLGPNAVPITSHNAYLRSADAPYYWAFAPFVKPQFTTSACSIATVTAALNGLTGLAPHQRVIRFAGRYICPHREPPAGLGRMLA